MDNRRGPYSEADKQYIAQNYSRLTAKQIATALKRNPVAVQKYIKENHGSSFQESAKTAEYDIRKSPFWSDLEKQFSSEELEKFLYSWGRIISQFKSDVLPTEEWQIADAIKLDLLMNRMLQQQQECRTSIHNLEAELMAEHKLSPEMQDSQHIYNLEKQIAVTRAAQQSLNDEFRDLLRRKNDILKEMKATRDARIKVLESSRHNFVAWMRKLIEDRELRMKMGKEMETMRLAANAEYQRLSEYHTYSDGEVDQPILNSDNILDE